MTDDNDKSSASTGNIDDGVHDSAIAGRDGRVINTGGGAYIEGSDVGVEGGDFVGRDRADRQQPDATFWSAPPEEGE